MKKNHDFDIGLNSYVRKCILMSFLLLGLSVIPLSGNCQNKEVRLTLKMENAALREIFDAITKKTGYDFVYSSNLLTKVGNVSVDVKNELLENVVKQILKGTGLGYKIEEKHIIVSPVLKKEEPGKVMTVTGIVKDENGESLPGVTVLLKGTSVGCASDMNGEFTITVPEGGKSVLEFTFIGMKKIEMPVKDAKPLSVTMEAEVESMDEVVVNGLFTQRKNSYTGAVTSVKGEELLEVSSTNVLKALAFLVPGMHIVENNEQGSNPNAISEIILRGTTALPVNGEYGLNTPLIILDGVEISLEDLYDLNMQDIEHIDVLKDASAKAIYGEKAANGVIVVTRKRVTDPKLRVRYNFTPNVQFPDVSSFNLCNGEEKLALEQLYGVYDSKTGEFDDLYWKRMNIVARGASTDWKSIPLRNSWSFDHSVNVTGRGSGMDYSLSLRYGDTRGVMKGDLRQRYGLDLYLSYNLKDRLTISYRLGISKTDTKDSPYGNYAQWVKCNPYDLPKDEYGNWVKSFGVTGLERNPMYEASLGNFNKKKYKNISNSLSFRLDILKGLYLNGTASYNLSDTRSDAFVSPESVTFISRSFDERGRYSVNADESNDWAVNSTLSYNWTINEGSLLSVNVGGSLNRNKTTNYAFEGIGFLKPSLKSINYASSYPKGGTPSGGEALGTSVGVFANVNFMYKNRYFVDGSYRSSGSSSVSKDHRWSPYWSAGIGWNADKEAFLADSFIDMLRFRASFGSTGSNNLANWETRSVYRYSVDSRFVTGIGATPISMANENLKASRTIEWNLGIDLSVFKERVQLNFNCYKKTTKDMLLPIAYPLSVGVKSLNSNLGEQENKGYDWSLSTAIINHDNLRWRITLSGQHNRDKIKKISNSLKYQNDKNREQIFDEELLKQNIYRPVAPKIQFEEGESSTAIFVVPSKGIDPATGREILVKKDGSLTFKYDPNDKVGMGNSIAKVELGLGTSFYWKGFSISAGMSITCGGWIYNATRAGKVEGIDISGNVDRRAFTERWHQVDDKVYYIGYDSKFPTANQTERFLEKRNEFYLSSLGVAYEFKPEWVRHIWLKRLRIGVNFSDVLRLSTVKFERGTSYPYMRGFNFTISPTF